MKRFLSIILLIPLVVSASINNWDFTGFINYSEESPLDIIEKGKNFELLQILWNKPQSLTDLKNEGFGFENTDTTQLMQQGMLYRHNNVYYSAIPCIDSIATVGLRLKAENIIQRISEDTYNELEYFLITLENAGYSQSAFALVHSLVFDDLIWKHLGVNHNNSTICHTDSMTWSGTLYFFYPDEGAVYGTNGIGIDEKTMFKFAWGNKSNAFLCASFIQTNVLKALSRILKGEDISDEMVEDCTKFGILDDSRKLNIPVLDGEDTISLAAERFAKSVAESFEKHFDTDEIRDIIGLQPHTSNEYVCKVILYHEILAKADRLLDEKELVRIPEVLKTREPSDKKQASTVAYMTVG